MKFFSALLLGIALLFTLPDATYGQQVVTLGACEGIAQGTLVSTSLFIDYNCADRPAYIAVCDSGNSEDDVFTVIDPDGQLVSINSFTEEGEKITYSPLTSRADRFVLAFQDNIGSVPTETTGGSYFLVASLTQETLNRELGNLCGTDFSEAVPANKVQVVEPKVPTFSASANTQNCEQDSIYTFAGCLPYDLPQRGLKFFFAWALSVGAFLSMASIAYTLFLYFTSAGDPKKLEKVKSIAFTTAGALALLILSVIILQAAGIAVLELFT